MANNVDVEGVRERFADGHLIQYSVRHSEFANRLPLRFGRSFDFPCGDWSTSWEFEAHFKVKPEDGSLSCTVIMRRTDDTDELLQVEFWMKLIAAPLRRIPPIQTHVDIMQQMWEEERTFHGIMQHQDLRQLDDEHGVLIQVSFSVRGCHMDRDLERLLRRRRARERQLPPLEMCSKL